MGKAAAWPVELPTPASNNGVSVFSVAAIELFIAAAAVRMHGDVCCLHV